MKIREHQKESLRKDVRVSVIVLAMLVTAFGLQLIPKPIPVSILILSCAAFLAFLAPYLLFVNPTLIKVMRNTIGTDLKTTFLLPAALWTGLLVYAVLAGLLSVKLVALSFIYCSLPVVLALRTRSAGAAPQSLDIPIILLLWLPVEFGLLANLSIPPVRGMIQVLNPIGLVLLMYIYFVLRDLPDVGLTFRIKGSDLIPALQSFMVFMLVALVIGFATDFIRFSRHMMPFSQVLVSAAGIAFLIALPEEILFRGIIHNLLEKKFSHRPNGAWLALVLSSLVFGLAHGNNANPPYLDISFGSLGTWHMPWVYMLLAALAGMAYGWTFMKTRKVTAAALVHLMVDACWSIIFNG